MDWGSSLIVSLPGNIPKPTGKKTTSDKAFSDFCTQNQDFSRNVQVVFFFKKKITRYLELWIDAGTRSSQHRTWFSW